MGKSKLSNVQRETLSEIVINFVRENPMLYDKTNPNYKDRAKQKKKWNELKENVNKSLNFGIKKGMSCTNN